MTSLNSCARPVLSISILSVVLKKEGRKQGKRTSGRLGGKKKGREGGKKDGRKEERMKETFLVKPLSVRVSVTGN